MTDYTKMIDNYDLLHNWAKPANHKQIQQIIEMDENRQFLFRRKARTSLIKATDMLPLRKLLGTKTKGKIKLTPGDHRVWVLPNNKTELLTLQVLAEVLPAGDLLPFIQAFCGLDIANSDIATREIAKDNLWQLERKTTHMRGKALKSIFWAGTPSSDIRKSSDDLLAVARAICTISYSKLFTRNLLTDEANEIIDPTITLTNFGLKELKKLIFPTMSLEKINHCMGVFLLAGWLKRIPEKYTKAGATVLAIKEGSTKDEKDAYGYTVAPSVYQMVSIDTVDWSALLDIINLDTKAGIRSNLVTKFMGTSYSNQFLTRKGININQEQIDVINNFKKQLQEAPNDVITKKVALKMLKDANPHIKSTTVTQHLKDLLVWKQFNLIEISSKLAYMLGFNSQKRTLSDKVIVNASEYYARRNA